MTLGKIVKGLGSDDAVALSNLIMGMMPDDKRAEMEKLAIEQAVNVIVENGHKIANDCAKITGDSSNEIVAMKQAAQMLLRDCLGQVLGSFHSGLSAETAREALELFMSDVTDSITLKFWNAEHEEFAAHLIEARNVARREGARNDDMEIVPAAYRDIVRANYKENDDE